MSDKHHEEAHTGPIKNSKQLLTTVVLAFILPVILIIGLVTFVGSAPKTGAGVGMQELALAQRLQKVGSVEVREADTGNRPLASGEDVYKAQCAACHTTGVSGAPKFGEASEWGPRLPQGFETLVQSSLKGKGAMAPQGGGQFSDLEIARGVAFLANAGGGKFSEPEPPAKEEEAAK